MSDSNGSWRVGQLQTTVAPALAIWILCCCSHALAAYPTAPEITDKNAPGQILIKLQDYAVAPKSGSGNSVQVARLNFLRAEPANAPGFATRFFVNDLNANIYVLNKTTRSFDSDPVALGTQSFLNLDTTFPDFDNNPGFAAGAVTIQFDPEYAVVGSPHFGKFYTTHTEVDPDISQQNYRNGVLTAWQDTNISDNVFSGTHRELIRVVYQGNIHPIGDLAFNPTAQPGSADYRRLYISSGDGGAGEQGATDPDRNRNQMLDNMLGKVLRIQPDDPDANGPLRYSIPNDNPYAGTANALGEIWAYGFRNPHRMAFDGPSGKLIVNDIGLHSYEEVNIVHKGANYGYSKIEGNQVLGTNNQVNNDLLPNLLPLITNDVTNPIGTIAPTYAVAEYSHEDGDAISSGFVYRGTKLPSLAGKYVFGDITTGRLFYVDYAQLLAQEAENGGLGNPNAMPQIHELQVTYNGSIARVFDLVRDRFDLRNETTTGSTSSSGTNDNDPLPGSAAVTDGDDPYGISYPQAGQNTGGRADIRLAVGPDGELYLISKSDGMIRALVHPGDYTGVFGDFNCDGTFTNADVQSMLTALGSLDAYKTAHTLSDADLVALGDFNHDSALNVADLPPMLTALTTAGIAPVPEPTTLSMTALGSAILAFAVRRRRGSFKQRFEPRD